MSAQAVLVRIYTAKNRPQAANAFAKDAEKLAREGYEPVRQSWEIGGLGRMAFALVSVTVTYLLHPKPAT
jgi:hypothetical protein